MRILSRDRDSATTWRASTRSNLSPASSAATRTDVCVDGVSVMNNLSGKAPGNLSAGSDPAESETAQLVARARTMMIISALTTGLAVAAVVAVIGYRMFALGGAAATEGVITLPKGARIVSMAGSSGRVAILVDIDGASEMRVFDMKTLKETGRL